MRALRLGLSVALCTVAAVGAYASYPGNDAVALTLKDVSLLFSRSDPLLESRLTAMIAAAEIDPVGNVFFNRPLSDQRFLEPDSGLYWQISSPNHEDFRSRSLGERKIETSGKQAWDEPRFYNSDQFADEPLRVVERTVRLPGSDVAWQFLVAAAPGELD